MKKVRNNHYVTVCLALIFSGQWLSAQVVAEEKLSPLEARAMLEQWIETERLISSEGRDWKVEQAALAELIDLYRTEIALLNEELEQAGVSTQQADGQKEKLSKEILSYRASRKQLEITVDEQAQRMLRLAQRFPQPLLQLVKPQRDVLKETEVSMVRERIVALLEILRQAGKFNRVMTYSEELQAIDGGGKRQLSILYMGLGRAYYLTGDTAGSGSPTANGWEWKADGGLREDVEKAIAIHQGSAQPALVELPVEVKP